MTTLGRSTIFPRTSYGSRRPSVSSSRQKADEEMTSLDGAVVLITGANGGIGTQLVAQALARGASKVYATARTPRSWSDERVVPLALDVTDGASVESVLRAAPDVTVLINNAGASASTGSILAQSDEEIRSNVETNLVGPLALARAYAPTLAAHGGNTAIVNIHSALSWYAVAGIYSATKAGLWSVTNSLRLELQPAGVQVLGVHVGYVDTAMAAHSADPKLDPADFVAMVFDTLEAGGIELLADDTSRRVKAGLSAPLEAVYPQLALGA